MFGTLKKIPANELVFGIDTHMENEKNGKFESLFKIPFERQTNKKP